MTHDELKESNSTIDFAELIEKQAAGRVREPAPEEEVSVRRPEANVPAQPQTMKNDGIAGDDMSDGEDDDTAKNSKLGRKGIYEDIIAKWSNINHGSGGDGGHSDNGDDRSDADDASDESSKLTRFIIYTSTYTYIHTYTRTHTHTHTHTTHRPLVKSLLMPTCC